MTLLAAGLLVSIASPQPLQSKEIRVAREDELRMEVSGDWDAKSARFKVLLRSVARAPIRIPELTEDNVGAGFVMEFDKREVEMVFPRIPLMKKLEVPTLPSKLDVLQRGETKRFEFEVKYDWPESKLRKLHAAIAYGACIGDSQQNHLLVLRSPWFELTRRKG